MTDYTPTFSFELIDFNLKPWSDKDHANWTALDRILATISVVPNNKGLWRNATGYAVGDYALDGSSFLYYQCQVAHTSPATGTFSDARTAIPANWNLVPNNNGTIRYDQVQVLSASQKAQAVSNLGLPASVVQQGGGLNQTANNTIKLGADATGLRADLNGTDQGRVWADAQATKVLATGGYQKLPSGLIIQWGTFTGSGGVSDPVTFGVPFPNNIVSVNVNVTSAAVSGSLFVGQASNVTTTGFNISARQYNGTSVTSPAATMQWLAVGY